MTFFYVMGGGWGHLYRVRMFINQLRLSPFQIVTNNPLAYKLFAGSEINFIKGDTPGELAPQLKSVFHSADTIYIDTFPAGLFGELQGLQADRVYYLARRLKWNTYKVLLGNSITHFDGTFRMEELEPEHEEYIQRHSRKVGNWLLTYPAPNPNRIPVDLLPARRPIWLIVHAFIEEEVEALVHYAKEVAHLENEAPAFVLLSDWQVSDADVLCHAYSPVCDWFPLAERIFVAGGFNTIQQTAAFRHKVRAIPFPRKYDDQWWRIRQAIGK